MLKYFVAGWFRNVASTRILCSQSVLTYWAVRSGWKPILLVEMLDTKQLFGVCCVINYIEAQATVNSCT